jgi:hypothetical protein
MLLNADVYVTAAPTPPPTPPCISLNHLLSVKSDSWYYCSLGATVDQKKMKNS